MSDLCHNCGNCHLGFDPSPCPLPLQQCHICFAHGHTYNFCPYGVHRYDPSYMYWMLCHNCDSWHLPQPCQMPIRQCERCHCWGHGPYFCPLYPQAREYKQALQHTGAKRQRRESFKQEEKELQHRPGLVKLPLGKVPVVSLKHVHPELLDQIRLDTAREVVRMLHTHTTDQILAQFSHKPLDIKSAPLTAPVNPNMAEDRPVTAANFRSFSNEFIDNVTAAQLPSTLAQPTPVFTSSSLPHTSSIVRHNGSASGRNNPYGSTEEEKPAAGAMPPTPTPTTEPNPKPESDAKRPKVKRAPLPDCADCKRAKKRCKIHREAAQEPPAQINPPEGYMAISHAPAASDIRQSTEQPAHMMGAEDLSALEAASYTLQAATSSTAKPVFFGQQSAPRYHGNQSQAEWLSRSTAGNMHTTQDAENAGHGADQGHHEEASQAVLVQPQTPFSEEQQFASQSGGQIADG